MFCSTLYAATGAEAVADSVGHFLEEWYPTKAEFKQHVKGYAEVSTHTHTHAHTHTHSRVLDGFERLLRTCVTVPAKGHARPPPAIDRVCMCCAVLLHGDDGGRIRACARICVCMCVCVCVGGGRAQALLSTTHSDVAEAKRQFKQLQLLGESRALC